MDSFDHTLNSGRARVIARRAALFTCLCLLMVGIAAPAATQSQCGVAQTVSFPVDPAQFRIAQDFGAASPRHQGRYHTGEDWYGGRGSYGTYVHAIADGRVTFSSPNGWGRDGGVIILEHTLPDGTTAYSMYGHVTDATGVIFPTVFTCVRAGDIIAAVGDPRPAPHLHFEIRTDKPDIPGPGYTWQDPAREGWRRPSKFVENWQAWALDSARWHADIADEAGPAAPPVELGDEGLIVLDANRALRISSDGRVLWRALLDRPAVGLIAQPENANTPAQIVYADGSVQPINLDSTLGARRETGIPLSGAPMTTADDLIFPTPDGYTAFDHQMTGVRWQISGVPPALRWAATGSTLGLMTADNAMLTIALRDGSILDRALLREPGSLAVSSGGSDDDLIAYTRGGLWRVDGAGVWSLAFPDAPSGGRISAAAEDADRTYLFDGESLHAYDRAHALQWATPLPGVGGEVSLSLYGGVVLLTSTHGDVIAVQASSGGVCNATQIYGGSRAREWHRLGGDGVLRVYVADQILGLDWDRFLLACG